MAMTNAERQAKWREKNRALFNLRRRRKKNLGSGVESGHADHNDKPSLVTTDERDCVEQIADENPASSFVEPDTVRKGSQRRIVDSGGSVPPAQKIEELRALIAKEHEKSIKAEVVPLVYRDDYGRVISERQWKALQKKKEDPKEGGYEIDEYSQ